METFILWRVAERWQKKQYIHSGLGEADKFYVHKEHELRAQEPVVALCSPEKDTEILFTKLYCVLIEGGQLEKQCIS